MCVFSLFSLLEPLVPSERIRWDDLDFHRWGTSSAVQRGALLSYAHCNSACLLHGRLPQNTNDRFIYLSNHLFSLSFSLSLFRVLSLSLSSTCFGPWLLFIFFFSPDCFCHQYCWGLLATAFQSCAVVCHAAEVQKKHLLLMLLPSLYPTDLHPFFVLIIYFLLSLVLLSNFFLNFNPHSASQLPQ